MPELSKAIDIWREVGNAVSCHLAGIATDSSTTAITIADYPTQSNRTDASNKSLEGEELLLTALQNTSTLTAALTASATSFAVVSGAGYAASSTRPYLVGVDGEFIMVTLSSNTFTVVSGGRGQMETRAVTHALGATVYGPVFTPNPNGVGAYVASTGVLTPSVTYMADPGTIIGWSIFTRGVTLRAIQMAVNKALRELFYEDYVPLTLVADDA